MADRRPPAPRTTTTTTPPSDTFLRKLHTNSPISTQLLGILALAISGAILLVLTGLTLTATLLALIFFTPLIILSSPIWVPAGTLFFFVFVGFLCTGGLGLAVLTAMSWTYKYVRGWHPPGSDRVDYARTRIADTANHVRDYAREYGGYLQRKVKDAAPGA